MERIYSLKMEGLEPFTGKVVWVRESIAGLELSYPLHPAVTQHLARSFPVTDENPTLSDDDPTVEIAREPTE